MRPSAGGLGKKENDLTYSLGWGLAQSETFVKSLLADVFPGEEPGAIQALRQQESLAGGGFTDIEIETDRLPLVLEAKVGWSLPEEGQLVQYAPRLKQADIGLILVVSECPPEFADPRLPKGVAGVPQGRPAIPDRDCGSVHARPRGLPRDRPACAPHRR
jgi:hypothetical protein